jgi:hypothetical protein
MKSRRLIILITVFFIGAITGGGLYHHFLRIPGDLTVVGHEWNKALCSGLWQKITTYAETHGGYPETLAPLLLSGGLSPEEKELLGKTYGRYPYVKYERNKETKLGCLRLMNVPGCFWGFTAWSVDGMSSDWSSKTDKK